MTVAMDHGRFVGRPRIIPCARRQRSERRRAASRFSTTFNFPGIYEAFPLKRAWWIGRNFRINYYVETSQIQRLDAANERRNFKLENEQVNDVYKGWFMSRAAWKFSSQRELIKGLRAYKAAGFENVSVKITADEVTFIPMSGPQETPQEMPEIGDGWDQAIAKKKPVPVR